MKCNKKYCMLSLLAVLALVVSIWAGRVSVEAKDFDGYIPISSADDLADIVNDPSGKYYLTKDIDMEIYGMWYPIEEFTGVLDGDGHAIKNLKSVQGGLFDRLTGVDEGTQAVVRDLAMENMSITLMDKDNVIAGGIAGTVSNGLIQNCVVKGDITVGGWSSHNRVGGVCGKLTDKSVVRDCVSQMTITYNASYTIEKSLGYPDQWESFQYIGGICGEQEGNSEISQCINMGNIYANVKWYFKDVRGGQLHLEHMEYVGGIVGRMNPAEGERVSIIECYNSGSIGVDGSLAAYDRYGFALKWGEFGNPEHDNLKVMKIYAGGICGDGRICKQ